MISDCNVIVKYFMIIIIIIIIIIITINKRRVKITTTNEGLKNLQTQLSGKLVQFLF